MPVTGEPPPDKVWTHDEKPVEGDANIRVANDDYRTHFTLRNAQRAHAGTYTLTATNESGTDTHSVQVPHK